MITNADLPALAREIIDATLYLALGTADEHGVPWVSPVYFAPRGYIEFYWVSSPEVTHSRNLAERPRVSIVIFDSTQLPGSGRAVYLSATAAQVPDDELDECLAVYNGRFANPAEHGLRGFTRDRLEPPATYRLYRAAAAEHSMICRSPAGRPCPEHGIATDHRTRVTL